MRLYTKQFRFAPLVAVVEHPSTVRDMHGSCGAGGVGDSFDWQRVAVAFHVHVVEAVQRSADIHAWHLIPHDELAAFHQQNSLVLHWSIVVAGHSGNGTHCAFAAIGDVEGTCWHVCGHEVWSYDMQPRAHPVAVFSQMP